MTITSPGLDGTTGRLRFPVAISGSLLPFAGRCDTRLDSSFYWGGISSVTDAAGRPVAFDLVSESGTDWRESFAPVPEPGTIGLLAAGLLALGRARRRG